MRVFFCILAICILSGTEAFSTGTSCGTVGNTRNPRISSLRGGTMSVSTPTLYDMPVSNSGARCRIIIYKKGLSLENDILIKPPSDLGGLKSPAYLALNPQGKMPLLVTEDGAAIPESDTIARYLVDRYADRGPAFRPATLQARTRSDLLCRLHDLYVAPIQGCMYKAAPPFAAFSSRAAALAELKKQLLILDAAVDPDGPYLAGGELSLADAAIFPTLVFVDFILPKFDPALLGGAWDPPAVMGGQLHSFFVRMRDSDDVFGKVYAEIRGALEKWEQDGRWAKILHAGLRDTEPASIFDKILAKQIPSEIVYEDDRVLAFNDISPQAPTHIVFIPKQREGMTQLRFSSEDHEGTLGHILAVAGKVAREKNLRGYRLVINDGKEAGQTVFHLHMHLLSGRHLSWPPG
mmetsp:Transcript_85514/g.228038  ORF Transcript_85514/g.228038 Transcript_85514/m.228038 type:complete len:407 (-) Transcript_85514:14-1234(-)